jgi:Regulator of Chromosome Condensation (RCC1) repeat protein
MHRARSSWLLAALLLLLGCHREVGAGPVPSAKSSAASPAPSAVEAQGAEDASASAAAAEPFERSEPILALGRAFTCFVDRAGTVHCWGGDDVGQRGGDGLTGALRVAAGPEHACAVRTDGIVCWGRNDAGQLGDGTREDRRRPVAVQDPALEGLFSSGYAKFPFATLTSDSSCFVWSEEYIGSSAVCVGAHHSADVFTLVGEGVKPPCPPRSLCAKVYGVSAAAFGTALCTVSTGYVGTNLACPWGPRSLAPRVAAPSDTKPPREDGSDTYRDLALGGDFGCARRGDSDVACWGSNALGQLGRRSPRVSPEPLAVPRVHHARVVCAGAAHACALREDGGVLCWGDSRRGQLGKGRAAFGAVEIPGAAGASSLACGEAHTCAAFPDDRVV